MIDLKEWSRLLDEAIPELYKSFVARDELRAKGEFKLEFLEDRKQAGTGS